MCGIIAARTVGPVGPFLLEALSRLEYRGYDSVGLAVPDLFGRVATLRTTSRVGDLGHRLDELGPARTSTVGIGHTRWATHGEVSVRNAHPHSDCGGRLAVAHNGVIRNASALRATLVARGHTFASDVDSEVVSHLVEESLPECGLHTAVELAVELLEGTWAIVAIDGSTGGIVAAAHESPLVLADCAAGDFVASDINAVVDWVDDFRVLDDGDVVQVGPQRRWRRAGVPVLPPEPRPCGSSGHDTRLDLYPDFMAKEIDEQPDVAARVIDTWASEAAGPGLWESFDLPDFRRVAVLGCGTSLNAGRAVGGVLERVGRVPCRSIIASEAADAVLEPGTLVLALSQSGETADVLGALGPIQAAGTPVLAITNNVHSALARRSDAVMSCLAGHEIGVAATKTFTAQVLTGTCAALSAIVASGRLDPFDAQELVGDLKRVPELLAQAIRASQAAVPRVVADIAGASGFVFLGRGAGTVYADEGALKLKELTYRWAESLPAGELKHGPLALVEDGTPVVVVDHGDERLEVNISEVAARGGTIMRIGGPGATIPALGRTGAAPAIAGLEWCGPLESVVAMQVLARELALALGRDVDKPRNLAKSVTVP